MTTTYVLGDSRGGGTQFHLAGIDDLVVTRNANVASETGTGILATGWGNAIGVHGAVFGNTAGIQLGDFTGGSEGTVHVFEGGLVAGQYVGVAAIGSKHTLLNEGTIAGGTFGVEFNYLDWARVVNDGMISAMHAVSLAGGTGAKEVSFTNRGTVVGTVNAYLGSHTVDRFLNRGEVEGTVELRNGNDLYDGRRGVLDGAVHGGAGNDRFLPGAGEEVFYGGEGETDTLDFRSTDGIRLSLTGGEHDGAVGGTGSGVAAGDFYHGFEHVQGSRLGADVLLGDGRSNRLEGFGGEDRLRGRGGHDRLEGGDDTDRIEGGLGNDAFAYRSAEEGGDLLLDFGLASGNDDRFLILAEGFGGGLVGKPGEGVALVAARFQARADNQAQDADDRFVFRTTDATLWWDEDGKGGAGPILLADLQAGASVTAGDILLI